LLVGHAAATRETWSWLSPSLLIVLLPESAHVTAALPQLHSKSSGDDSAHCRQQSDFIRYHGHAIVLWSGRLPPIVALPQLPSKTTGRDSAP